MSGNVFATDRDERTCSVLREAIASGTSIAFVGAGMSARAGYRDWSGLLDKMSSAVHRSQRRPTRDGEPLDLNDFSWRAEEIREQLPDTAYFGLLEEFFQAAPKRDAAIALFAKLGFRHVFTTNYDRSIEEAMRRQLTRRRWSLTSVNWAVQQERSQLMPTFGVAPGPRSYLVYLHGRANKPETIVLSERDYRSQYVRSDETVKKLFAIFSMRQAAFFGFSLRDLDVLAVFRQVRASNDQTGHFAVLPDEGEPNRERIRARYVNKFGIHPIFYVPGGEDHPNLVKLIEGLGKRKPAPKSAPVSRSSLKSYRGPKWVSTSDFNTLEGVKDSEDPQKGRFGGSPRCNGRELRASVTKAGGGWFNLGIEVVPTNRRPLQGRVDLWVHDSFPQKHYYTQASHGRAKFSFTVYGAFTVGAVVDNGKTPLELDLAQLPDAPREFRMA